MKIEIEISEEHEGTSFPWWLIVDPVQNMSCDPGTAVINQITGPFFSREAAQEYLTRTRYNFSKRAVVWCHSGHQSDESTRAVRKAKDLLREKVKK